MESVNVNVGMYENGFTTLLKSKKKLKTENCYGLFRSMMNKSLWNI